MNALQNIKTNGIAASICENVSFFIFPLICKKALSLNDSYISLRPERAWEKARRNPPISGHYSIIQISETHTKILDKLKVLRIVH